MLALCREHRLEHRTKHIALRYFLARELQQRGQLRLAYVASEANTADIFTKALAPGDHQRLCTLLGYYKLPTTYSAAMFGFPRSNNGSSVTSPSRPTASPAADNSYLQQQHQQQQYQQQPMYGMPLSSQPVHTTAAAASSTAAAATAATAASTAAAAVSGSSS
ncbi:unnamed protein product [Closterium sp. NIES-53]